jgi:hypothetical protein
MATTGQRSEVRTGRGRRRPRRRRGWIALLVVLVVLAGLLVAADRIAAAVAGRQLADRIATSAAKYGVSRDNTEVTVEGFPFLTQVVAGRYDGMQLTLHNVGQNGIVVDTLRVHATGITLPPSALMSGDVAGTTADSVTGTAELTWQNLADSADVPDAGFRREGDAIRVRAPLNSFGIEAEGTGLASVTLLGNDRIRIEVQDVQVQGVDVPQRVVDLAATKLSQDRQIPKLPYGLTLTGVQVVDAGIQVTVSGRSIPLAG